MRETGCISADEYPEVNDIVQKDIYVDDCLSGGENIKQAVERADKLQLVLSRGGLHLMKRIHRQYCQLMTQLSMWQE